MVVVLIMVGLLVLAVVGGIVAGNYNLSDGLNTLGFMSSALSAIALIVLALMFAFNHGLANATIAEYNSIKETIEVSREDEVSDVERAALTQKIIEVNKSVASYKYWNETVFHLMVPDRLADLEYLK